jgi:hypothetical protein
MRRARNPSTMARFWPQARKPCPHSCFHTKQHVCAMSHPRNDMFPMPASEAASRECENRSNDRLVSRARVPQEEGKDGEGGRVGVGGMEEWKRRSRKGVKRGTRGRGKGLTKAGTDGKPPTPPSAVTLIPKQVPPVQLNNDDIVVGTHALPRMSARAHSNSLPPTPNPL